MGKLHDQTNEIYSGYANGKCMQLRREKSIGICRSWTIKGFPFGEKIYGMKCTKRISLGLACNIANK
jgi:hypothetical protein